MKLKSIIFFIMVFGFFAICRNALEQTAWVVEGVPVPFCISQQNINIILPSKSDINSPPGIVISSPPVKAMLPGIEETGNNRANIIISKPTVDVILPGIGNTNNTQLNNVIENPPVIIEFE